MANRAIHSAIVRRRVLTAAIVGAAALGAGAVAGATPLPTPPEPDGPTTTAVSVPPIDIASVIDIGDAKPPRSYDAYLAGALHDIQVWWASEFPRLYGKPYRELAGGIYAAYPERTTAIPGCGTPQSTYQDVSDFGAFYCSIGDFMAYDDGEQGVLYQLAEEYGPSILAVVMAHEFGHAIQERADTLDRPIETVLSEQQADCFSGAWSRRAWNGEASGLPFGDADVRTGLTALVSVRDPAGTSVYEDGGHGSAFDRIGAYQHGFIGGVDACVGLLDQPLPLLPNKFRQSLDAAQNGNAQFGYADNQIMGLVQSDLISFWPDELTALGRTAPPLIQLRPVDPNVENCGSTDLVDLGAMYCAATGEVLFNELRARDLYDRFGDFAVGYVIGHAWADGIQAAEGLTLGGEAEALVSDCLVGAWVSSAIGAPDDYLGPTTTSPTHPGRTLLVSPGDLDEAIQTDLLVGDVNFADDLRGSAFEKVAYLRLGVLDGTSRCFAEAQNLAANTPTGLVTPTIDE